MFNILSQITLKVKFLRNEEQHCLLPSLVDDFTCVHSKNALLTHILSTLFSSTSVLFSCAPFGTKSYIYELTLVISIMCNCLAHSHQLKVNVWGGKWWQCTWTNSATKRTSLAIAPVLTTVTPQLLHLPDWCCFMQSYPTTCQSYPLIQLHTIHTQPHTSHTKQHTSHRFNPNYMPVTLNHTPNNTNHTVTPTTPNCMSYN